MLVRSDPKGGNRTRPSTAIYRIIMLEFERQRLARGLSMAQVDDLAGTNDGHYGHMAYPDTPTGRQARWETVQIVAEALFGRDFTIEIIPSGTIKPSALGIDKGASTNALKNRHWRHSRHFKELGSKGGKARFANKHPAIISAMQRRAAKMMWRKIRKAKRKGEEHRSQNSGKRSAAMPAPSAANHGQREQAK